MATDSIADALLAILDNQIRRTAAALADLPDGVYAADPGGDCNSIAAIGAHLVMLRKFQLSLLGSDKAAQVATDPMPTTATELTERLAVGADLVRQAIVQHDRADWLVPPTEPRDGPWADEPTLQRLVRPINDFTNHLGAIRAIRRILGCPAEGVQ